MRNRKYIDISPTADIYIYGALALMLLPLKWIIAAVMAAVFHECCHYLALRLCRIGVYGITIGVSGMMMETEPMSDNQELICALAGPAGSMLLVLTIRHFPELAICAAIQGLYNLLPIFPLDGGRAVSCVLGILWPDKREILGERIQQGVFICIFAAALYAFLWLRMGFGVLIAFILLLRKVLPRKTPCKDGRKRVQ